MKEILKFPDSECGHIKKWPKLSTLTTGGLREGELAMIASPVSLGIWPKTNMLASIMKKAFVEGRKPIILCDSYSTFQHELENKVETKQWLDRLMNIGWVGHFEPTLTPLAKTIQKVVAGGIRLHG